MVSVLTTKTTQQQQPQKYMKTFLEERIMFCTSIMGMVSRVCTYVQTRQLTNMSYVLCINYTSMKYKNALTEFLIFW